VYVKGYQNGVRRNIKVMNFVDKVIRVANRAFRSKRSNAFKIRVQIPAQVVGGGRDVGYHRSERVILFVSLGEAIQAWRSGVHNQNATLRFRVDDVLTVVNAAPNPLTVTLEIEFTETDSLAVTKEFLHFLFVVGSLHHDCSVPLVGFGNA
jgi:hypothetical protein